MNGSLFVMHEYFPITLKEVTATLNLLDLWTIKRIFVGIVRGIYACIALGKKIKRLQPSFIGFNYLMTPKILFPDFVPYKEQTDEKDYFINE